ncbi:unnamed protein product [Caretta caretta]
MAQLSPVQVQPQREFSRSAGVSLGRSSPNRVCRWNSAPASLVHADREWEKKEREVGAKPNRAPVNSAWYSMTRRDMHRIIPLLPG